MADLDSIERLDTLADRHYAAGDATRKPVSYLREYARILGSRRTGKIRILELGVSSGASLLLWRDYLPQAVIVGLDIGDMPQAIAGQDRIHFIQASQDDRAALDRAAALAGGAFDLIVDDASHIGYLTKRSFCYLFPTWLVPGGTYVIEDFGTGFLPEYPDGSTFIEPSLFEDDSNSRIFASHQYGMVGVVKQLLDHMMQELMTGTRPYLAIERMTILTNIAFIEKSLAAGGPLLPARVAAAAEPAAVPNADLAAQVTHLQTRVSDLEMVLGNLLARLDPLRRLRRMLTRR